MSLRTGPFRVIQLLTLTLVYPHYSPSLLRPPFGELIDPTLNLYAENTNADREWKDLGCSGQLPIEPEVLGHWDEACLVNELMSPFATGNEALSRMTIGAFEDLGYDMDYNQAEAYGLNDLNATGCGESCPE